MQKLQSEVADRDAELAAAKEVADQQDELRLEEW